MMKYILPLLIVFIFSACFKTEDEDIKIGFVAGLSGKYSGLGTSIRDGFTFSQVQKTGGGGRRPAPSLLALAHDHNTVVAACLRAPSARDKEHSTIGRGTLRGRAHKRAA